MPVHRLDFEGRPLTAARLEVELPEAVKTNQIEVKVRQGDERLTLDHMGGFPRMCTPDVHIGRTHVCLCAFLCIVASLTDYAAYEHALLIKWN